MPRTFRGVEYENSTVRVRVVQGDSLAMVDEPSEVDDEGVDEMEEEEEEEVEEGEGEVVDEGHLREDEQR